MKVEIWSDFVCPFCYLGERKFELALAKFAHKETVEIHFKSFQLNQNAENYSGKDIHQLIADKYHIPYAQAKSNNDRIIQAAKEVGLNYNFDILKPGNTQIMHQIAQYAKTVGKEKVLVDLFFKAYFEEGADISDTSVLLDLASKATLDTIEVQKHLTDKTFLNQVHEDQHDAQKLGITGVPYFIINDKITISGAQSPEHFLAALNQAWLESN